MEAQGLKLVDANGITFPPNYWIVFWVMVRFDKDYATRKSLIVKTKKARADILTATKTAKQILESENESTEQDGILMYSGASRHLRDAINSLEIASGGRTYRLRETFGTFADFCNTHLEDNSDLHKLFEINYCYWRSTATSTPCDPRNQGIGQLKQGWILMDELGKDNKKLFPNNWMDNGMVVPLGNPMMMQPNCVAGANVGVLGASQTSYVPYMERAQMQNQPSEGPQQQKPQQPRVNMHDATQSATLAQQQHPQVNMLDTTQSPTLAYQPRWVQQQTQQPCQPNYMASANANMLGSSQGQSVPYVDYMRMQNEQSGVPQQTQQHCQLHKHNERPGQGRHQQLGSEHQQMGGWQHHHQNQTDLQAELQPNQQLQTTAQLVTGGVAGGAVPPQQLLPVPRYKHQEIQHNQVQTTQQYALHPQKEKDLSGQVIQQCAAGGGNDNAGTSKRAGVYATK